MKILADGTQVSASGFYFLLDFNDRTNKKAMIDLWKIWKLQDLTKNQYIYLFKYAMETELKNLENG